MAETDWPVALRGVTETVVTTLGPNDRWNAAALGVHASVADATAAADAPASDVAATARTWGETRTRRNLERTGEGYVQFTRDAEDFARAALTVFEHDDQILDSADAWARVSVERLDEGREEGIEWVDWALEPVETAVEARVVPTTNRGYGAVVEATVAASRLDVAGYDCERLRTRLAHLADVIETCGGPAEQRALAVIEDAAEW